MYNIPDISQDKMSKLFEGLNRVHAYEGNVLVTTKDDFINDAKALENSLDKRTEVGLKIKTEELSFRRTKIEYLSLWVSNNSVNPPFYK